MSRSIGFGCVVLACALVFNSAASAQQPGGGRGQFGQGGNFGNGFFFGGAGGVPGYEMLQVANVEKELGLNDEQKEKLKELRQKNLEEIRSAPRPDFAALRDMEPEERQKKMKEFTDQAAKRAEEARKQVAEILTPKQVEQLKDMAFRQWLSIRLRMSQTLQDVELTEDQNKQIQTINEETQAKIAQVQRESQEKTVSVLTADQVKKLKEQFEKQPVGLGAFFQQGRGRQPQRQPGE
jgi:Spy/CpxP family protein refolding chaperone